MSRFDEFGHKMADWVTSAVGSWKFVFIYTFSMIAWIVLHVYGVLDIDSKDFIRWNLWLSYFAGIQASILLMSAERQSAIDRARAKATHKYAETSSKKIQELVRDIGCIEEVLNDLIKEVTSRETKK